MTRSWPRTSRCVSRNRRGMQSRSSTAVCRQWDGPSTKLGLVRRRIAAIDRMREFHGRSTETTYSRSPTRVRLA
jgi:hypothetical protein